MRCHLRPAVLMDAVDVTLCGRMADTFEGWAIVELMGHRRLAGLVREVEIAGAAMLRLDVPEHGDEPAATQFYSAAALYCLTPTTEAMARQVAAGTRVAPVQRWELPAPRTPDADDELADVEEVGHGFCGF